MSKFVTKAELEEYTSNVMRTATPREQSTDLADLLHSYAGIATEVAELVDIFKKRIFYGKAIDMVNLQEEIGDCFWYIGLLMSLPPNVTCPDLDVVLNEVLLDEKHFWESMDKDNKIPLEDEFPEIEGITKVEWSFLYRLSDVKNPQRPEELVYLILLLTYLNDFYGFLLKDTLDKNIEKLKARFPDKFDQNKAINRDLNNERKILEK